MSDTGSQGSSGTSGSAARPAAAVLQKVRETGLASAMALFKAALEATDDALFGFGEKSETAAERGQYMDAMRSLRLARPTLEQTFRDQLASRFQEFQRNGGKIKAAAEAEILSDALSLVEENDLEEDLAVNGMVSKAVVRHHSALYALHQRLAAVLGVQEVTVEANPFGPPSVCQALRAVVKLIEAEVTVRLVVFKVFDRRVVVDLDDLYDEVNKVLADAGVLPHIKFQRPPRVAGDAPAPRAAAEETADAAAGTPAHAAGGAHGGGATAGGGSGGAWGASLSEVAGSNEVVAALAQLLMQRRESGRGAGPGFPVGPALGHGEVLAALSRMQSLDAAGSDMQAASLLQRVERVKDELLEQLRKSGVEHPEHRVAGADEDAIDLVSMLFQFVVQDRNLPAEIQAVLSRLQIPYVRVAVKDKHLFAQREHPARVLLDAMAVASVGWSKEADRDGRFLAKLEEVVRRITTDYADDLGLFSELEGDFTAFLDKQKKQSEVAENRATEAALGREKLAQARRAAIGIVAARLARRELPPLAREVLHAPWTNFLVLTHLRHGPESTEWKGAVNFIDAVVWACLPKVEQKDHDRLRTVLPQMLGFLRHGLSMVGFGDSDANRLVHGFGALFQSLHSREVALDHAEAIAEAEKSLDNAPPSAGAAAVSGEQEAVPSLPDDDEFLVRVRNLKVGTWVEFADGQSAPERAKISWISPVSARLLFVNRKGLKVAERSVYTLANELRDGVAQILEVAPIFERALNSIMSRLKYEHLLASGARPASAGVEAQAG